ncbi:MAG: GTP diphosphokinase [Halieaceae bacterium]|nr:GTP diphosphokinase [Halieaceae bacterium]
MVRVRAERDADAGRWLQEQLADFPVEDREQVGRAFEAVCAVRASDSSEDNIWYGHGDCRGTGLDMVEILSELHMGADSLVAAMLYRAVAEGSLSLDDVEGHFGAGVAKLLRGVQRMSAISDLNINRDSPVLGQADAQKDNIRKMLIALVDDVRVALIKLAERTCAIRAVKNDEANRRTVAQEVFDVYAPLAHRLGIGHLKWELEDLSFRYLYQDNYHKIARLLDGKRLERDRFIERVKKQITETLAQEGIDAELRGRSKHIYSIWRKMQRKGIGFSQVYDIRAVRILVPDIKDCYAALGIVHGLWRNIPNEFDDYIANPKENGYRSLHTAVIGPEGKILEIQIRTFDMDEEAELGVCAHWRYKGSDREGGLSSSYEEKIAWLRQVLDWHEETGDVGDLAEQFSAETSQDRVYVFTPDGDVVNLAAGATPLDFAYHVHTEVGHSCRGAKVNGSIVPLTYQLHTGERVQILTGGEALPKRDWLQPGLGYLKTHRARAKVQHWFRAQARDENIDAGRRLLEREFKRLALTSIDYKRVANRVQLASVEDMFAAVGAAELSAAQVLAAAQSLIPDAEPTEVPAARLRRKVRGRDEGGDVQVQGIGNLLSHLAGCCKPVPGDGIIGFITQGRGVSVHRRDCSRLLHLQMEHPERIIEVSWGSSDRRGSYEVDIGIEAYDRPGLLRDITELLAAARINVLSINTSTSSQHIATMRLRVEVPDLGFLGKLLNRISGLNNVMSARRLSEDGVEQAG